jgi:hypothetical protein
MPQSDPSGASMFAGTVFSRLWWPFDERGDAPKAIDADRSWTEFVVLGNRPRLPALGTCSPFHHG